MRFNVGSRVQALEGPVGRKSWQAARVTSAWEYAAIVGHADRQAFYSVALDAGGMIVAIPEYDLQPPPFGGVFTAEHARRMGALERDPGESVLGYYIRSSEI